MEVGKMKLLLAVTFQLFLQTTCRVMLYDILTMGESSNNMDSKIKDRWMYPGKSSNGPFYIKDLKSAEQDKNAYKVFQDILSNHQVSNDVCVQSALKMCDIRPMAQLLDMSENACTLFKEFDMCLERELMHCSGEDVTLLRTSIQFLMEGYQANGKCKGITVGPPRDTEIISEVQSCNPHDTWQCAKNMVANLRGRSKTCDTLRLFRQCIHRKTRSCSYDESKYLRDASKGLSIIHRHSHLC